MARWEPAAQERLQAAALELFAGNRFEETTVAAIAAAAGLTERTFYRYFADKREVLFAGAELLEQEFLNGVAAAGKDASPLEIVASAVTGAAGYFPENRRSYSRRRHLVISANPELHERELRKMASLATAVAGALRERGVPEPAATLAAESGVTVFRLAFEQWIGKGAKRSLADIERDIFDQFGSISRRSRR